MRYSGLRRSGRSIIATFAAAAILAGLLIGVSQSPAAAVTPPVAVDDTYTTYSGTPLVQAAPGVLANDTDDVGPVTASGASDPPYGSVTLNANGSFTYTPDANFVGTDTFTYTVSDGVDGSDTGLVTITVPLDPVVLIKDVNPAGNCNCSRFSDIGGGNAFFYSFDGTVGGLYKTDGTAAGTVQLKSLDMGTDFPTANPPVPVGGGKFVFPARDTVGGTGKEVWVTDGTPAGTTLLLDINPGSGNAFPNNFTAAGGSVFFQAQEATNGAELWKTDGTPAGTVLVKDINPGTGFSSPNCGNGFCNGFTPFGSGILFTANDGTNGTELWTSDGTAAGTVLVKDIRPGSPNAAPQAFTVLGSTVLFSANDGTNGTELWKTDGTTSGTVLVKDINTGSASGSPSCGASACNSFPTVGSTAYFGATTAATGAELWKTDGSTAGTVMVKDIRPGTTGSLSANVFSTLGSTLLFSANDGTNGIELWKSNGTDPGTVMVANLNPGSASSSPNAPAQLGSYAYFGANNGSLGNLELFKTDGTTITLVKDINPGSGSSAVAAFAPALGTLLFSANNGTLGTEPHRLAPANVPPVANNDAYSTNEDTPLTVNAPGLIGNDTDANSNVLHSAAKVTDPANGSVTVNGDGSFTYTPAANYNGPDSFTYKVSDGMNDSNVATVNLTVNAVVDIPVAANDSYSTNKNTSLTVAAPGVLGNDTDGDGDPLTAASLSLPANGAVAFNANGSFTYTPNGNYVGADSFTYKANDGINDSNVATVNIAVTLPAVLATPPTVAAGSPVTATWSGVSNPSATDWVGLYDTSATPDPGVLAWAYTGGATAGNLNLVVPAGATPGATYELRLFSNNTYTRLATSGTFTVTASATTISASPGSVNAGGPVTATWAGIASPTAVDWVGLYDSAATPDAGLLAWAYTGGGAGGNLNLGVPLGSASGAGYELRLFANNTYTRLATSAPFTVVASNPAVSASPGSVAAGSPVIATWSGIPVPSATDWVGLYANSADPDPAIVAWTYTDGNAAGNLPLTVPSGATPGATYELRLFSNNTYSRLATSAPFTVTASVPATISSSVATVANGNPLTATWSGIPVPSATDWVGLYAASGDPDPAIVAWVYTGGGAAGSVNLVVPLGSPPGATYELRLYSNNTYTRLATSVPFTVT